MSAGPIAHAELETHTICNGKRPFHRECGRSSLGAVDPYTLPLGTASCCSTIPLLMRRLLASLMLFLQLAGFALPFVQAQQAVPACCRRAGQHHCAMPTQGDGFRSIPANCPYRHVTAITSHSVTALGVQASALTPASSWHGSLSFASPDIPRYVEGNAQKRGPPLS